jgi:hypothetical protein
MESTTPHCTDIAAHCRPGSPFRMIVLLYYDLPLVAVLRCESCDAEYYVEWIDWDYGDPDDRAIYRVSPLPPGSFEELVEIYPKGNPPHWPVWMPRWEFPSAEAEAVTRKRADEVLGRAGPPDRVVAWLGGWGATYLAGAELAATDLPELDLERARGRRGRDWFAFLGLDPPTTQVNPSSGT